MKIWMNSDSAFFYADILIAYYLSWYASVVFAWLPKSSTKTFYVTDHSVFVRKIDFPY